MIDTPSPDAIAMALLGHPADAVVALGGTGNSRAYRVDAAAERFLLKLYPDPAIDGRDRLGTEYNALGFLNHYGFEAFVARPVASDASHQAALYSWLDGVPIGRHQAADVDRMVEFATRLHRLSAIEAARGMSPATEACLSAGELLRQIDRRLGRLRPAAIDDAALASYLADRFLPAFDIARQHLVALYDAAGLSLDRDIVHGQRCLSPSDFGFHNCLRRADGRLAFVDFEYFGWDDPVRLVADFLCHPAMALTDDDRQRFHEGTAAFLSIDPDYEVRLRAQLPLVALRWCLILLNEFLPDHWRRRLRAGQGGTWQEAKTRQLEKAGAMLELHERFKSSGIF